MELYDNGLFTELGELMAYDQAFYEDTPKQHYYASSPVGDSQQLHSYSELNALEHPLTGGGDELDSLLAEGNRLLDRFMVENGLHLLSNPVDLADVDELVSVSLQKPVTDLVSLNENNTYDVYQQLNSPTSSISTLPSEPATPVDLFPVEQSSSQPAESQQLTDLLESLLGEQEDQVNYNHYDYQVDSPAESDLSYNTSTTDLPYINQSSDLSWEDDSASTYSSTYSSPEPVGKAKPKKKSKSTPYSKLPAGRKERKKQQNKEAAIRYREKKKAEAMTSQSEEDVLTDRNKELKTEVLNLEREIMCMKELLSDVFNIHSI